jgi:hypothetical protein
MMTVEEDYTRRIGILKTLDVDGFISCLNDKAKALFHSLPADKQRDSILGAMHKGRYEMPEMTEGEREESRQWLQAHNLKRLGNLDFPPR